LEEGLIIVATCYDRLVLRRQIRCPVVGRHPPWPRRPPPRRCGSHRRPLLPSRRRGEEGTRRSRAPPMAWSSWRVVRWR
jgi:hypothetical protein